jgi:hypothetical protein
MKNLILLFSLLVFSLTSFGQDTTNTYKDSYIQLSSFYFIVPGKSNVTIQQKQMIWDQGRYFKNINPESTIILKAYSSKKEYKLYGDKLLVERMNKIKNILINDCGVDSSRFIFYVIGDLIQTNNNPVANQRVDVEILN